MKDLQAREDGAARLGVATTADFGWGVRIAHVAEGQTIVFARRIRKNLRATTSRRVPHGRLLLDYFVIITIGCTSSEADCLCTQNEVELAI